MSSIARASRTPASYFPRQIGTLTPTMSIQPQRSVIVYAGPVRTKAMGKYIDSMAEISACARPISARPTSSSGRWLKV